MHITEGIITGTAAVAYTAGGVACVAWGASKMKRFVKDQPDKRPLLGMGGALIFFFSLIPIPAFTGTCTHPCGTPLIGILLGPGIGTALTAGSLLLQAAFFAHGGFATWGANVIALGLVGCVCGWGTFRLARRLGFSLRVAGFAGGLVGDVMVYAASGLILAATLAHAPTPQYSLLGYLTAIYGSYLPTQLPIAIGEMLITGLALHFVARQRPEVLAELGVTPGKGPKRPGRVLPTLGLLLLGLTTALLPVHGSAAEGGRKTSTGQAKEAPRQEPGSFAGMDEAVNERLAEAAGAAARAPYLDPESWGDLWNTLLLGAGGVCGFVLGRWWHLLFGRGDTVSSHPSPRPTELGP
jgi:cobalt/nickel transport system permease protein